MKAMILSFLENYFLAYMWPKGSILDSMATNKPNLCPLDFVNLEQAMEVKR